MTDSTPTILQVTSGALVLSTQGGSRAVLIDHLDWDCRWVFQFPECIASDRAWYMDCQPFPVRWRSDGASLSYTWRADAAWLAARREKQAADSAGPFAHKRYEAGLAVQAVLTPGAHRVGLRLEITNESEAPVDGVECDGGCFQAHSEAFSGTGETARTFLCVGGQFIPLSELPRTVNERCLYVADPVLYDRPPYDEGAWFWGRSNARPDVPCVMGMASVDARRAVAVVFEQAYAGSANADGHHCLHSRPRFGTILPGETVTRSGAILFGPGLEDVFSRAAAE